LRDCETPKGDVAISGGSSLNRDEIASLGLANRTALYAGLDVVGPLYATKTEFGRRFRHIVASDGAPAAVRWLAAESRD
jgi:hypothetical protein